MISLQFVLDYKMILTALRWVLFRGEDASAQTKLEVFQLKKSFSVIYILQLIYVPGSKLTCLTKSPLLSTCFSSACSSNLTDRWICSNPAISPFTGSQPFLQTTQGRYPGDGSRARLRPVVFRDPELDKRFLSLAALSLRQWWVVSLRSGKVRSKWCWTWAHPW